MAETPTPTPTYALIVTHDFGPASAWYVGQSITDPVDIAKFEAAHGRNHAVRVARPA